MVIKPHRLTVLMQRAPVCCQFCIAKIRPPWTWDAHYNLLNYMGTCNQLFPNTVYFYGIGFLETLRLASLSLCWLHYYSWTVERKKPWLHKQTQWVQLRLKKGLDTFHFKLHTLCTPHPPITRLTILFSLTLKINKPFFLPLLNKCTQLFCQGKEVHLPEVTTLGEHN